MNDIIEVFTGAINSVLENKKALLKALIMPFALLILLSLIDTPVDKSGSWPSMLIVPILIALASLLLQTIIAVTTHRIILLGENAVPTWGRFFSMYDLRFILYTIIVGILMIPAVILMQIPVIGMPISIVLIVYLLARLSLIFPAVATGQKWSIWDSWRNTQQYQLLMLVTVIIFPIIFSIPEYVIAHLPFSEIPVAILSGLTTIFMISALSVAFKWIVGDSEIEDEYDEGEYHPIPSMDKKNPFE